MNTTFKTLKFDVEWECRHDGSVTLTREQWEKVVEFIECADEEHQQRMNDLQNERSEFENECYNLRRAIKNVQDEVRGL